MMKNWNKMIAAASVLASLTLFAGCTTASAVSLEEAKDLVKARVGDENAVVVEQETDREDGVYELDIIIDGAVYEFEVDSRTGTVRQTEGEQLASTAATQPAAGAITLEEARAIAYAHAGVDASEARDKSQERDDGIYEIDFEHGGWEYEYHISLRGEILRSRKEADDDRRTAAPAQPQQVQSADRISAEEALTIALDHAGVSDARDRDVEWDDGRWEGSFDAGRTEYEYHISAAGEILGAKKDIDD